MIDHKNKWIVSGAILLLAIGIFASVAVAPSAIAINNLNDLSSFSKISDYQLWFDELGSVLESHGFEVVNNVDLESIVKDGIFYIEIKENISYQNKKTAVDSLYITEEKLLQEGREGYNLFDLEVVVENGKILIQDQILIKRVAPIDQIKGYGTKKTINVDGEDKEIERVFVVEATAYTEMYPCTGKTPEHPYYGITAAGVPVEVGHIAVDPKVIPYFSEVYVEGLDVIGREYTGKYLATDTGGAIKGNKIDVYIGNYPEVYRFGRRNMKLFLLKGE